MIKSIVPLSRFNYRNSLCMKPRVSNTNYFISGLPEQSKSRSMGQILTSTRKDSGNTSSINKILLIQKQIV